MPPPTERLTLTQERAGIKLLYYFAAVAEELSFSKAAARLNMSQPPLSVHIKELEVLLGTPLFIRNTRHVDLTAAGRALFADVQAIQNQTRHSLQAIRQIGRGQAGHLHLGLVGTACFGKLLPALRAFSETRSGMAWSLEEMPPFEQVRALSDHRIDVGFWREASLSPLPKPLICQLFEKERLCLAVSQDHPLSEAQTPISLARLLSEKMIGMPQKEHSLGRYLFDVFQKAGCSPLIAKEVKEPQTALALVGIGEGVTVLPESYARMSWPHVRFLPLDTQATANLYAVFDPKTILPMTNDFLAAHVLA